MNNEPAVALEPWRIITIGKQPNGEAAVDALQAAGWGVYSFPLYGIMSEIQYRKQEEEIKLFLTTVSYLGFTEDVRAHDVLSRAEYTYGYRTDVHEVLTQLCLDYDERPFTESFRLVAHIRYDKYNDPVLLQLEQSSFQKKLKATYPVRGHELMWKPTDPILLTK